MVNKKTKEIYQFKITLKYSKPPIYRRIQVPDNYTFWDLHVAIQDSMGWMDCHLHEFQIVDLKHDAKVSIGIPDDEGWNEIEILPSWDEKIKKWFNMKNNTALYIYDFGDNWEHDLILEKIIPVVKNKKYPLCIDGKRNCPPEDVGGIGGYENMLEILADKENEEREEFIEWLGYEYDSEKFEKTKIKFTSSKKRLKNFFEEY